MKQIINKKFIKISKLLIESSLRLLIEEIEDVRGQLKKKIERNYITALQRTKQSIVKEISDALELQNSGTIKSAEEIKNKLNTNQLKYLIKSLRTLDFYFKEIKKFANLFEKSLMLAQSSIHTNKELYEFLENLKKSETLKQWVNLINIFHKTKKLIDESSLNVFTTKEFVSGYIDILEVVETSIEKYISTLTVLKENLKIKHTAVSPDEIENDEELREQFLSRIEKEIEKQFNRKMSENDFRLIDIVMDVIKGDASKEQNDIRNKLKKRDVNYQSSLSARDTEKQNIRDDSTKKFTAVTNKRKL